MISFSLALPANFHVLSPMPNGPYGEMARLIFFFQMSKSLPSNKPTLRRVDAILDSVREEAVKSLREHKRLAEQDIIQIQTLNYKHRSTKLFINLNFQKEIN